jgi:hypothetical protein
MKTQPFCVRGQLRKTSLILSALLLLTVAGSASVNVPDWVLAADKQTSPAVTKDSDAVVLLDEQTTMVADNGETSTLYRRVVKILRPQGRDYAEMPIFYDKETKLKAIHAWTVTAKGVQYELKEKDFYEHGLTTDLLYDDTRVKVARLPGLDPGTVVAVEYEQKRRTYLFADRWNFQERIPVALARYTLRLPAKWEYSEAWAQYVAVKPVQQGANQWTWEVHDVTGIEKEPGMPFWESIAGRMMLSFYGDARTRGKAAAKWDELALWYAGLTQDRATASPEIAAMAKQLTANASDFVSKVSALTGFMQRQIRYVAIEIGIGGYQPHLAADTFRNRYGDCKDKANLLVSMLHEVGIPAAYVLVHTERGFVTPDAPGVGSFNHAITAIEVPSSTQPLNLSSIVTTKSGKKYVIFDPTDPYTPFGQLRADLQGSYGLLSTAAGGELIQLPILLPDTNELNRVAHLKLQPDGSLIGDVQETRTGENAWSSRYALLSSEDIERSKRLDHFLGGFLTGFTVNSSGVENLENYDRDLVLKYSFTAKNYAKNAGPLILVRPRVLGEKEMRIATDKPRKFPVQFSAASHQTDIFEIELPQGYSVDELPEPVKVDVGFAEYESKTEVSGQTLRYTRAYTVKKLLVPTSDEASLKRLFGTIYADERNSAVLKKAN